MAEPELDRPQLPSFFSWYVLALLTVAYGLSLLDRTIVTLLVEFIQTDLGISDTQFGLLQGLTFGIFYLLAGIPIGWLVDRASRVRLLVGGIAVWSLMTMLSGGATRFSHLFLARIGVAAGEATLNPAGFSLLADLFPKEKLGKAIAIFSSGSMVGTGLAYAFGGTLISFLGAQPEVTLPLLGTLRIWQVAFIAAGAPGLLLALVMLTLREPARPGLVQAGAEELEPPAIFPFVRSHRLIIFLHFSAFALMTIQAYSFMTWAPALLFRVHGLAGATVGIAMGVATGLFGMAGFFSGGWLGDYLLRRGVRDAHMRVGFWAMIAALPVSLVVALSSDAVIASIGLSPLMFFLMAPVPAGIAGLQLMVPPQLRGRMSAFYMVVVNLAGLGLGPVLAALFNDYVFQSRDALNLSLAIVSCIVVPLSVLAFALGRRRLGDAIEAQLLAAESRQTEANRNPQDELWTRPAEA